MGRMRVQVPSSCEDAKGYLNPMKLSAGTNLISVCVCCRSTTKTLADYRLECLRERKKASSW